MAAQATDGIAPTLTVEKHVEPDKMKEQDPAIGHSRETASLSGHFGSRGDCSVYAPNVYAPLSHGTFYKGYENAIAEWDEYHPFFNADRLEMGSPGVYNDNPSLVFHSGYSYSPQMPYGQYSPVATPLPSVGGDTQLFASQQYPFSGPPYYQPLGPPSVPYITSPSPTSQPEMSIDQQIDRMLYGPRPSYPPPPGSFNKNNFPGNPGSLSFHNPHQGYDAIRSGLLGSDWPISTHREQSFIPSSSMSSQTIGSRAPFGQNFGMGSQQLWTTYRSGSCSDSYDRGHLHAGFNQNPSFGSESISSFETNCRGWPSLDTSGGHGWGSTSLCSCTGTLDILSEKNRGPRASKPKSQVANENSPSDGNKGSSLTGKIHDESFNCPDFGTEYSNARFFIIKSYSEDNVHKSIKYGVWASTPNGNRKLDAAYREAKEKERNCPVFLLFSVNASAQFCGVAEMFGPVDFEKSVDFWQQDKWSGQFPVKWHIIKDVPNSQFRHIVIENNDNKPVTNSRDTQEVKLEQGIEMLKIFKNFETDMSILDDFSFYEDREKAMQQRKARQQGNLVSVGLLEDGNVVTLPNDFIKQMSKSFNQVVSLEESGKEGPTSDKVASALDSSIGTGVILKDAVKKAGSSI